MNDLLYSVDTAFTMTGSVYSALFQIPTFKIYFPKVKISIEVTQTRLRRVQRHIQYGSCKDTGISTLCTMGVNSPR